VYIHISLTSGEYYNEEKKTIDLNLLPPQQWKLLGAGVLLSQWTPKRCMEGMTENKVCSQSLMQQRLRCHHGLMVEQLPLSKTDLFRQMVMR
jgi:hypothetical protein